VITNEISYFNELAGSSTDANVTQNNTYEGVTVTNATKK
jgi:hypothetical protein